MSYAADTSVPVEKSQAEIQRMLMKAGAAKFAVAFDGATAAIQFQLRDKVCRFTMPLPDQKAKEFQFTPGRGLKRKEPEAYAAWQQACRSRWRALALAIKAKLEAVEIGLTTFEQEFLAFIITDNGQTIGERVIPQINASAQAGHGAKFLLTLGGGQ